MLRINLLPASLGEQKKVRLAIILASLLFAAVLIGMLGYHFGVIIPAAVAREEEATNEENEQARVQKISDDAKKELAQVKPILDKVEFVESVQFHNTIRQTIFANAARYTVPEVEYNGMSVNANVLTVSAFAKNLSDLGRFYLYMFGNPDLTAVSIQGIPAWPPANRNPSNPFDNNQSNAGTWFPVQLTGTLVRPVVTPQLPATLFGAQGGQGGFGGGFGGPGGFSGGPPSGFSGPPAGGFSGPPTGSGPPPGAVGPGPGSFSGPPSGGAAAGGRGKD